MTESTIDITKNLNDLLDTEREALLFGHIEHVEGIVNQKTAFVEQLRQNTTVDPSSLAQLNNKLERNQKLLDSALDGIRSVSRRLAMMRRVRNSLETYDSRGLKTKVDMTHKNSLEKRA